VLAHIPDIEKAISEIIRVTKPNGMVVLEFYNPLSIKYLTNKMMRSEKKVYTRFDSYSEIKKYLDSKVEIQETIGARIILPHNALMRIPVLNKFISASEKALSRTVMNRIAGYFIVAGRVNKRHVS